MTNDFKCLLTVTSQICPAILAVFIVNYLFVNDATISFLVPLAASTFAIIIAFATIIIPPVRILVK